MILFQNGWTRLNATDVYPFRNGLKYMINLNVLVYLSYLDRFAINNINRIALLRLFYLLRIGLKNDNINRPGPRPAPPAAVSGALSLFALPWDAACELLQRVGISKIEHLPPRFISRAPFTLKNKTGARFINFSLLISRTRDWVK